LCDKNCNTIAAEKAINQNVRCPSCAQDPVPVSTTEYNWDILFQGEPRTTTNNGTSEKTHVLGCHFGLFERKKPKFFPLLNIVKCIDVFNFLRIKLRLFCTLKFISHSFLPCYEISRFVFYFGPS